MSAVAWALCLASALPAGDEAAREAAMFGETATVARTTSAATDLSAREDAMFGDAAAAAPALAVPAGTADADDPMGATRTDAAVTSLLREAYDKLSIGGLFFLQADAGLADYGDALAPVMGQPAAQDGLTTSLASPSFFDVYLDARPMDRLRAYMRGRVSFDASAVGGGRSSFGQAVDPFTVALDQAWLKLDVAQTLFVTIGREKVKFGVGRLWNPTDFVNRERLDALSGVTVFDRRNGVGLLKLHLPVESLGWNFYAIATLDGADALDEPGGVLRAELLLGTTELALSGSARKDSPQRLGLSVSTAIWWFDVKAEAALTFNSTELSLRGACNVAQAATELVPGATALPASLGEAFGREDEVVPQLLAGAELGIPFGDEDTFYVGGEYFYNHAGYADGSRYACLIARPIVAGALGLAGEQPGFTPFYLGQHYVGAYAFVQAPGRWDDSSFFLSAIANVSDGTGVVRFDYRHRALRYLNVNVYVTGHVGERGGEYRFAFRLPSGVAAAASQAGGVDAATQAFLRDGVPAPILEAGVGLQVAF